VVTPPLGPGRSGRVEPPPSRERCAFVPVRLPESSCQGTAQELCREWPLSQRLRRDDELGCRADATVSNVAPGLTGRLKVVKSGEEKARFLVWRLV